MKSEREWKENLIIEYAGALFENVTKHNKSE